MPKGGRDRGLAVVAGAQRGLARRSQLFVLGIGRGSVAHRVSRGSLHQVLPAVFAVGHPVLQPLGAETAALLYVGQDGVLSHRTACALWGIADADPDLVAVTVIGRRVRHRPGLPSIARSPWTCETFACATACRSPRPPGR